MPKHLVKAAVGLLLCLWGMGAAFGGCGMLCVGVGGPPAAAGNTVSFDAVASNSVAGGGNTLTWTHTPVGVPTGVGVGVENFTANCSVSSITYGAASLTQAVAQSIPGQNTNVELWGVANPPAGPQTVTVNFTGSTCFAQAGSITVTGGSTSTVFRATNSAQGSNNAPTVSVTSATGDLVVDVLGETSSSATPTAGGSQTLRWGPLNAGSNTAAGSTLPATGASTSMSWSLSGSVPWGHAAASFQHN